MFTAQTSLLRGNTDEAETKVTEAAQFYDDNLAATIADQAPRQLNTSLRLSPTLTSPLPQVTGRAWLSHVPGSGAGCSKPGTSSRSRRPRRRR